MDDRSSSRRILTLEQLATDKGIKAHKVTIHRWEVDEKLKFPKRFYITSKMPVWWEHEVDAWLLSRSQAEPAAPLTAKATARSQAKYQADPEGFVAKRNTTTAANKRRTGAAR